MTTENDTVPATAVEGILLPNDSDLTREDAEELDRQIDHGLAECETQLQVYLDTGYRLARMKSTKGFQALGFENWGDYVRGKAAYGQTFISFLIKLGGAGDPTAFFETGMKPAVLIHYLRNIGYPEKLPELVALTYPAVKDKSPKEAGKVIKRFVDDNARDFKKPRKQHERRKHAVATSWPTAAPGPTHSAPAGPGCWANADEPINWEVHFNEQYRRLDDAGRKPFVNAMRDFIAGLPEGGF